MLFQPFVPPKLSSNSAPYSLKNGKAGILVNFRGHFLHLFWAKTGHISSTLCQIWVLLFHLASMIDFASFIRANILRDFLIIIFLHFCPPKNTSPVVGKILADFL